MTPRIAIIGGGGHARVVVDLARALGRTIVGIFDDRPGQQGQSVDGCPVVGTLMDLVGRPRDDFEAVVAIGANDVRLRVASECPTKWATLVHPAATVSPSATLGHGTLVMAGAVVQPGTTLGDHVVVNTRASVDHDGVVADGVHIAPGATVCGGVHIGDGALVGAGAVLLPGARVGAWAVVGAGAVVRDEVPAAETWVGVPAKRRVV
ncbi:MAG: acetyltransferase [Fimbriimonadaceae bacterium]|nr:acetyltransferase [Fimbriimonadaceae bacterium]